MSEEPVIVNTVLKPKRKYTKDPNKFYGAGAKAKNLEKKDNFNNHPPKISEVCEKTVISEKEAVLKQDGVN